MNVYLRNDSERGSCSPGSPFLSIRGHDEIHERDGLGMNRVNLAERAVKVSTL